jgi:hypothetical protein
MINTGVYGKDALPRPPLPVKEVKINSYIKPVKKY